jgi:hypothetical protein
MSVDGREKQIPHFVRNGKGVINRKVTGSHDDKPKCFERIPCCGIVTNGILGVPLSPSHALRLARNEKGMDAESIK